MDCLRFYYQILCVGICLISGYLPNNCYYLKLHMKLKTIQNLKIFHPKNKKIISLPPLPSAPINAKIPNIKYETPKPHFNKPNTHPRKDIPLAHRYPNPGNQRRTKRLPIFSPRPPNRPFGRHIPAAVQHPPEKSAKKQDTHHKEYPIHHLYYCCPVPDPFLTGSRFQGCS